MAYGKMVTPADNIAIEVDVNANKVTRTSASKFTVTLSVRWQDRSGKGTKCGMRVETGSVNKVITPQGTKSWLTGKYSVKTTGGENITPTYSISGEGSAKKTIEVVCVSFFSDGNIETTKQTTFRLNVTVPPYKSSTSGGGGGGSGSGSGGFGGLQGQTHKVVKGDTLWGIAEHYFGDGTKYKILATWNKIKDPNKIYIGQIIYLYDPSASGTASQTPSDVLTINQFGALSTKSDTLLATWDWSKTNTAGYKVHWDYDVGNGIWLKGTHTTNNIDKDDESMAQQSTYNIPQDAVKVRFRVKPVSEKKKDDNGNESEHWTFNWLGEEVWKDSTPLATPSVPSEVDTDRYKLNITMDGVDIEGATSIVFEIVKDNSDKSIHTSKPIDIITNHVSYSYDVEPGSEYKVRCKAHNKDNKNESDWSGYSKNVQTIPSTPEPPKIQADSKTSIYLVWDEVNTAKSYDIEYATNKDYFDITDQTKSVTGKETTSYKLTSLESGVTYFCRIRANNDKGSSSWSENVSVTIGTPPAAPTTWSSTTTVIVGEPLTLYWIHNTEDGSSQTLAELELQINSEIISPAITIKNLTSEDDKDKTRSCEIDTVNGYLRWVEDDGEHERFLGQTFIEGTKIQWRVRTAGITNAFGDWSTQRMVDIYAPPTLDLRVVTIFDEEITTLENFPFLVYALAGPKTQKPIGYHLEVTANELYETRDNVGNFKVVNAGEKVYSKYFDTEYDLYVEMSANNITLENGVSYTVTCNVSMDSGLTATASKIIDVSWSGMFCEPNAEIVINQDDYTATIRPYCSVTYLNYHKVERVNNQYVVTDTVYEFVSGEVVKRAKTTTGEQVYSGVAPDGEEIYYARVSETSPVTDVYLSVFRREYDGKFTELASRLLGYENTTIVDPHPALDYARYRIVATNMYTGTVSYIDLPGQRVGGNAVVIQWDEEWSEFDVAEGEVMAQPAWSGSMLKLPYNIDISDTHKPDIELVEYIGRSHPLTYYGTQLGATSSWSMVIPKSDKDTLYALRRLAAWLGDVYVREPSGSGYWANITVSFSQKHKDVKIPVTLNLTRVEGGA